MAETMKLADVIRGLREEIAESVEQGRGKTIQFALDRVEVELQVSIQSETNDHGGIDIKVFSLGVGSSDTEIRSHSIRLTLDVEHKDEKGQGRRFRLSDD